MALEAIESQAEFMNSVSYKLNLIGRARQLNVLTGVNFVVGEGFLRSVYFSVSALAPIVTSITPGSGQNTAAINITNLAGANFVAGASVKLTKSGETDINAANVSVVNSGTITCTFDLTGAAGGLWNVTVINPDNRSGSLSSAFSVTYPAPQISSVSPDHGFSNAPVNVEVSGSAFRSNAGVKLLKTGEGDLAGTSVVIVSSSKITCIFDITGKTPGIWDLTVVNDDNQSGTLSQAFKIEALDLFLTAPVLSAKNPFNPAEGVTTITYGLSRDANISVYLYNIRGERVWQYDAPSGSDGGRAGTNEIVWSGITGFKSFVSIGVYIVHVVAREGGQAKILGRSKIAIIK